MTQLLGFISPWIIYLAITILHYLIPSQKVTGYVKHSETGELLNYRLNGRRILIISVLIWFALGYFGLISYDWLYEVRWYSLAGAFVLGLIFSLYIVLPNKSTGKSLFADLYFGRLENPQFNNGRVDVKIWLYMIGAIMLQLNVLSFASHQYIETGELSSAVILISGMLTFFVWDYLSYERVHLYTYDFFAERVGIKLAWGCLTFYPYFYLVALWATVDMENPNLQVWQIVLFAVIFLIGWIFARGANMQKFYFKINPDKSFLGIKPEIITDGEKKLLVNGFWGLSRHVNYLGEILMATGIALATGYPEVFWVWLYPLYYVALLVPRQISDDKRCSLKYGSLWKTYTQKVKYRIIPYIY